MPHQSPHCADVHPDRPTREGIPIVNVVRSETQVAPHGTTILSSDYLQDRNILQVLGDIRRVRRSLTTDLQTQVRERLPLERVNDALRSYRDAMTGSVSLQEGTAITMESRD
jgi:hypothetical protein